MKKFISLLAILAVVISCGGPQNKTQTEAETTVVGFKDLMEKVESYVGQTVTVTAVVEHVCSHGGGKMFLSCKQSDKKLKVEPSGDLQSFDKDMEGSKYEVTGVIEEMKIDEEYLAKMEQEMGEKEQEQSKQTETIEQEEGEKHSHCDDKQAKIVALREQIAASGKGYISFYTLKATKISKIETVEAENQAEEKQTQEELKQE